MNTVAIIPARGGSKSIPKKNIVSLHGKPLIRYAIDAAKKSAQVKRVIVSTDSDEIAAVARACGAETPFVRPKELAEDTTPTIPVIVHTLEWLEKNEQYLPEYVLLLQPTEPFVKPEHIDQVLDLVIEKHADSGITMIPSPRIFHPYHVRKVNDEGFLEFAEEKNHYTHPNRQSDPPRYAFGNVYWFRRDAFMREKKIEVGKRVGVPIDPIFAHDINSPADLRMAELLLQGGFVNA